MEERERRNGRSFLGIVFCGSPVVVVVVVVVFRVRDGWVLNEFVVSLQEKCCCLFKTVLEKKIDNTEGPPSWGYVSSIPLWVLFEGWFGGEFC